MSANEKSNLELDQKNNDEAVVELSPTEANAVAGGVGISRPPDLDPQAAGELHTPGCVPPPPPA
ncbi:MAG TPA: hypothetical protein PK156_13985 [Polyangium sp.]|nr:hypothetical protein [Polyangium sp.]